MFPTLHIFNQEIPSYGILVLIGFFVALVVALLRHKINQLELMDTFVAVILAGFGAFAGGKIFYVIQGIPEFIFLHETRGVSFIDYFSSAGLVYYGGFIGCILFIMLFCVIYKVSFWQVIDTLLPSLPLAQAFGRVGCFAVGCCYGIPSEHGFIMNASQFAPHDVALLPIQLIESASVLALFIIMVFYGRKVRKPGKILSIYFIGYGLIRFILEFFRYDAIRGFFAAFSTSQWISLILIGVGLFFAFFYRPKNKTIVNPPPSTPS